MRKQVYYSDDMKRMIVSQVLSGELSMAGASRRYKIGGKMTVSRWISKFISSNPLRVMEIPQDTEGLANMESANHEISRLKEEIKRLQDQLELEKLRVEAYETMIQIAEKEYHLPIRKKSGTKQSRNLGISGPNQG